VRHGREGVGGLCPFPDPGIDPVFAPETEGCSRGIFDGRILARNFPDDERGGSVRILGGEGVYPLLPRYMGRGVIPSEGNEGGGGRAPVRPTHGGGVYPLLKKYPGCWGPLLTLHRSLF